MLAENRQETAVPLGAVEREPEVSARTRPELERLHLSRSFLAHALLFVIPAILVLRSDLAAFPALHVVLDTINFALPLMAAILLHAIGRHSQDDLLPAFSMAFGTCSILCLLHLACGIEWWGQFGWIAASTAIIRPKLWAPSAYFLPLAMMMVLLRTRDWRDSTRGLGAVLIVMALALLATFWNLPPYAQPSFYGMHRPLLLAVPVLWALVALQASWLRPHHAMWQAVPRMAVFMIVAEAVMVSSAAPQDAAAVVAHTGTAAAYSLILVATLKLAALETRRRVEAQEGLESLARSLERRVAMRTSELQSNLAELKAYERAMQRQTRHATLQAEVLLAFTQREDLHDVMAATAATVARELDVDVAQVWTLPDRSEELELQAHVGTADIVRPLHHSLHDGGIAAIARRGEAMFSNEASHDERVGQQVWARKHAFVSFAGCPLELEGRIEGVVVVYSRRPLEESELTALGVAASAISLGIAHKRDQAAMHDLYDHAPCGYHSLDENGVFLAINETELSWIGYTRDEIIGRKRMPEILTPDSRDVFATAFPQLKASGSVRDVEFELVRKDGSILPVLLNATAITDRKGRFLASRGTMVDMTDRKRIEQRATKLNRSLRRRSAALEEANRELETFSYTVSHDLRAPLRRIRGFADLLVEDSAGELPEKLQRYVQVIHDSSNEMSRLIDDFLALSRTSRQEIHETPVALGELVREVIADFELPARKQGVSWHVHPLPDVRADRGLLKQVLANLVDNALKYSRGRSDARIEIGSAGSDSGQVVIYVRDNGVGFSMEEASNLFGVFQRLPNSRDYEGSGVGLATVQRIIQRHGGRVWAEAAEGQGAAFYFTLRAARADERLAAS